MGPAITGIVTFLLLPVISNYLPPTGQGILGILETIQRYFLIFATLQIHAGIVRMYLDLGSPEEEKRYAGSIFVFLLLLNTCATLGLGAMLYFFSDLIFEDEQLTFYPYIALKLIYCFILNAPDLVRGVFYAKQEALKVFLIKILILVVDMGLTLYLLIEQGLGVQGILIANIAGVTAALPVFLYYTFKHSVLCFDWKYVSRTLVFCLPFIPGALATATYEHADRYLLQAYMTLHEVGIYTFAQRFLLPLSVIVFAIDKAFMPVYISHKKANLSGKKLNQTVNQLTLFLGLATIGLVYFATEIKVFVNEKYAASFDIIAYIAIFWFLRMIYLFPGAILIYFKKSKYFLAINIIPAAINVLLNIWLIPIWGIDGAIVSTLACGVLTLVMTHLFAFSLDNSAFNYMQLCMLSLGVALLCIANNYLPDNTALCIVSKVLLIGVYLVTGARILGISLRSTIRELWER